MSTATMDEIASLEARLAELRSRLDAPPPRAAASSDQSLGRALGKGKVRRVVGGAVMAAGAPFLFTPFIVPAAAVVGLGYLARRSGTNTRARAVQEAAPGITRTGARRAAGKGRVKRTVGGALA
ncbi:MAG: hypothetical protein ACRDQZ_22120, partial [Mycobacteriales bacterium]